MFERSTDAGARHEGAARGEIPRVRLAQLAESALSGGRPDEGGPGAMARQAGRLTERWLPAPRQSGRRRMLGIAAALVVVALVALAVVLLRAPPAPEVAPPLRAAAESASGTSAAASAKPAAKPAAEVVVSVVGKVSGPGLYTLPGGARVADAVRAAGGANPDVDLATLNLARKLTDGEQVYVGIAAPPGAPAPGGPEPAAAPAASGAPGASAGGTVELNSATAEQLDALPGVGEVTAQRILDWRTQHGSFTSVEQLREVDGIGETRFGKLREQVSVG